MKNNRLWAISLLVICILNVILAGTSIFGWMIPDALRRAFGILELVAIPVLIITSIKAKKKE